MECAYIDNLNAAHMVEKDGELQRLMAENALQNVGAQDQFVAQRLRLPHVRRIILRWVWLSRSSLLHRVGDDVQALRKAFRAARRALVAQDALLEGRDPGEGAPSSDLAPEDSPSASAEVIEDSLAVSSIDLA